VGNQAEGMGKPNNYASDKKKNKKWRRRKVSKH
jgi:hypothetical protein